MTSTTVTKDDIKYLARGAAVLGTGGGGDPHIGKLLAEATLEEFGPIELVPFADLTEDDFVVPVGMMGAPTVMVEKVPSVAEVSGAVERLAEFFGKKPTHIACLEAGGVNSTFPFVAAAQLGLPLVDGDMMGRAFPELQMAIPTIYGHRCAPMLCMDEKGNSIVLDTVTNLWAERIARTATVEMGCSTIVSLYAMNGAEVAESFVPGTLSKCIEIGKAIENAHLEHSDPVAAVADTVDGVVLFDGKVTDLSRRTEAGWSLGEAKLDGSGDFEGQRMTVHFQNEHLMAEVDGRVVLTTPDLIITLDSDSAVPITTENIRFGSRITVLGAPCDERWHSEAGLELAGPRYFRYDVDPVRVADLV